MNECNSIGSLNIYQNWNDQQQFRLNKVSKVRDYFIPRLKKEN